MHIIRDNTVSQEVADAMEANMEDLWKHYQEAESGRLDDRYVDTCHCPRTVQLRLQGTKMLYLAAYKAMEGLNAVEQNFNGPDGQPFKVDNRNISALYKQIRFMFSKVYEVEKVVDEEGYALYSELAKIFEYRNSDNEDVKFTLKRNGITGAELSIQLGKYKKGLDSDTVATFSRQLLEVYTGQTIPGSFAAESRVHVPCIRALVNDTLDELIYHLIIEDAKRENVCDTISETIRYWVTAERVAMKKIMGRQAITQLVELYK